MQIEKMSASDLEFLKSESNKSKQRFFKLFVTSLKYILPLLFLILIVPMEYLKLLKVFKRKSVRTINNEITGSLLSNFNALELTLFVVIPIVICFLFLFYFYFFYAKLPIAKDRREQQKEIISIAVLRVSEISGRMRMNVPSNLNVDYYLWLENNKFKMKEYYFNSQVEPEFLNAKSIVIERTIHSKLELSKRVITE